MGRQKSKKRKDEKVLFKNKIVIENLQSALLNPRVGGLKTNKI